MSENISVEEVCRLLETLDEWEEVALQLGLSDQMIQEIRELSGGNSVRRKAMVSKWIQCEELEPSWSKLEKALVSANQEAPAAKLRARLHAPKPGITTDIALSPCSGDTKEASYRETEIENLLSTVDNKTFKEDDWNVVLVECGSLAAKWEQLSACLGLAKADIDSIRENCPRDSAGCWSEALSQWIKQNYSTQRFGLPSWRSLLKAMAVVDKRLVKELATKHPSEMLRVPSAVVQSPASPQGSEKSAQSVEMIRSNVEEIKAVFSSLLLSVQSALEFESSADNVRQFMISFFEYDFPKTMDIKELLNAVTLNRLWDYQHYSPVERLANHLLQSDQGLQDLIKAYKACLSGFYLTTKLIDYIEYLSLSADDSDEECDQPSPKLTTKQYRKIKVVLHLERKVSQLSLEYVVKLWESFAEEYEIPSLTAVINRIVAGSLEVTWRVPQHIADAILPRSKFFQSHGIVLVFIDDVIIYDEKQMAAKEKRFLKLRYDHTADIRDFSSLLMQGVDPNIRNESGLHPIWWASGYGRQDLVELFLKFGADIDMATKNFGDTALVAAVDEGHLRIAEILVKNGANVNYRNKKGKSVLWKASYEGHTEIVLLLLRHHAEVDLPTDDEHGETALFAASQEGRYDPAALLIEHGADVNYLNKQGVTPLYYASKNNHVRLVQLLLAHGADINKGVQSPLYVASTVGNMEMVQLLVHHHAAIDQPTDDDEYAATPLITACEQKHVEVTRFLLGNGADINRQNKNGWSSLLAACYRGHIDVVRLLIQSNANIELKNKEGRTALMIASWKGYVVIVMELIRAGAKTDTQDQEGLTSLMLATQNGHDNVVEALLNANADPNITEHTIGWTTLHFAAKSANLRITKLLLAKGADTELRDKNGLIVVEICEDEDVCDELRRHTISQSQTNTQPTEVVTVEEKSDSEKGNPTVTENQRNEVAVKKSYQKLLQIFDLLEESLLPGRKEKKLHQQREASNIAKSNQQLLLQ